MYISMFVLIILVDLFHNSAVTNVTYNSVQLNWQPAIDETGVDKYLVYRYNTLL
ncbi:hypothetical protein J2T14_002093 [Paenibacillus harenae]|nr:hypothetical protein [Paenibacillus harenae]